MKRSLMLSLCSLALGAALAFASPAVRVSYQPGVAIVRLEGDWSNSRFTILRAGSAAGAFETVSDAAVLCLGECAVADAGVAAGRTYWYRFDLVLEDGRFVSFGPYPVTISSEIERRVVLSVSPQPLRGPAELRVVLAGAPGEPPARVRIALYDVQGRRLRVVHDGALARGRSTLRWDGRDAEGRALGAGAYLLRAESPLGAASARVRVVR